MSDDNQTDRAPSSPPAASGAEPPKFTLGVPPFNRHPSTNAIVDRFVETSPGELLLYAEIDRVAQCERLVWRGLMTTVKKVLQEEYQIGIACEARVGYRHLKDAEIAPVTERTRRKLHRTARRGRKFAEQTVKNYLSLSPAEQREYNTQLAQLGFIEHASTPRVARLLSRATSNSRLEIGDTIEVIKRGVRR